MAHRALGDTQFLGGAREAHVSGGGLERLERVERGRRRAIVPHVMRKPQTRGARLWAQAVEWQRQACNGMKKSQPGPRNDALHPGRKMHSSRPIGLLKQPP